MRIKKIGFVIFLLTFTLVNLFAQSVIINQKETKDSTRVVEDSSKTFFDFEIFANIGTSINGDNEQKGLPIAFGLGIPLGRNYYLYPEYKIKINGCGLILLKNIHDGEMVVSIGRVYGKNKLRFFPKVGLTAFYQSDFYLFYCLILNIGFDLRYKISENSSLFSGFAIVAIVTSESKFIGKNIKIGFSTNF